MAFQQAFARTFARNSVRHPLTVAIVVGTALNLINQGPEILEGSWPVMWKVALTYLVPFLVACYESFAAFRSSRL